MILLVSLLISFFSIKKSSGKYPEPLCFVSPAYAEILFFLLNDCMPLNNKHPTVIVIMSPVLLISNPTTITPTTKPIVTFKKK